MLSKRSQQIKPSPTLAVTAKARELKAAGKNILSLSAGEPDFDTPNHIKQAAISALNKGYTKYTAVDGIIELKQAIQDKCQKEYGQTYSAKQVIVSCGAKHSIYTFLSATIDPEDEILIPVPYWVSYPDMVKIMGGIPVLVEPSNKKSLKVSVDDIEAKITEKTKLLIINSPSNPSGAVYHKNELAAIAAMLKNYPSIMVLSDDIYEHIYWDETPFANMVSSDSSIKDRFFIVNGVSKSYAMTGWRIGYCVGNETVIRAMATLQSQSTSNPNSIAQYAALQALTGPQEDRKTMMTRFKERFQLVYKKLNAMPGVSVSPASGAFYIYPDFSRVMERMGYSSDVDFASALLEESGVAVVPGSAFGTPGHIRISYATSEKILNDALGRIAVFIST